MGDRCYLEVYCLPADVQRIITTCFEGFCEENQPSDGGLIRLASGEALNHGDVAALGAAAESGLRFFGRHSSGDNYPAGVFFTEGNTLCRWFYSGDKSYELIVNIEDDQEIRLAKTFHLSRERFKDSLRSKGV